METPQAAADSGNHPRQPTQTSYFYTWRSDTSDPSPSNDDVHSNTTPATSSVSTNSSVKATVSKIPTTIIVGGCVVVTVAAVVY